MSKVYEILDRHLNDAHGAGQTYRDITNAMKEIAELAFDSGRINAAGRPGDKTKEKIY